MTTTPGSTSPDVWPVVVIGCGAAGAMAAIHAARTGAQTLVLESSRRPGAKIRVSGGGRCNVLPSVAGPEDFHTEGSVHAMRKILTGWPLDEVTSFFRDDLGIALKTEETGKVFPVGDDAREVVTALLQAVTTSGAELRTGVRVVDVVPRDHDACLEVVCDDGERILTRAVVLATGGLSLPKTGSDGVGYRIAASRGHDLLPRYPALVPVTTSHRGWADLAGIATPATVEARRDGSVGWASHGDLLITHRGFSGPVALDASHRVAAPWGEGTQLTMRFGPPDVDWDADLQVQTTRTLVTTLRDHLPRRLAEYLCGLADVDPTATTSVLRREERQALVAVLDHCAMDVDGDEGYRVAEVTGGGIRLEEVVIRTLESRLVPGLFLAGEVLDVTGRLGGYNFLWAWASGRRAGLAAAAR